MAAVAALTVGSAVLPPGAWAAQRAGDPGMPAPAQHAPWFGPDLTWGPDAAARYVGALRTSVSLLDRTVAYPLDGAATAELDDESQQASRQHAVAVVTLAPRDLPRLTGDDATALATEVARLARTDGTSFLVRFAPEMNGPWNPWGQLPVTYVQQFRTVATAVHAVAAGGAPAAMVWAPAYGGGYPFATGAAGSTLSTTRQAPPLGPRSLPYLDTDGDGRVTGADDPYGPYYPGDQAVDWVGLTVLPRPGGVPAPGALDRWLEERQGYPDAGSRPTFYTRYSTPSQHPVLLTTAAAAPPGAPAAAAAHVELGWLRQVLAASGTRSGLGGVLWFDRSRVEPGTTAVIDRRLSSPADLAIAAGRALVGSTADLGPVSVAPPGSSTESVTPSPAPDLAGASAPPPEGGSDAAAGGGVPAFLAGVLSTLGVVAVVGVVTLLVRRRRSVPTWLR